MREFKYKPPRVHSGELRTPITFYEYKPNQGPEPGESEKNTLYNCMGKIDEVWLKDVELAKSNGTLSDITITIRDPLGDYIPTDKHYISIDHPQYKDNRYNVKHVQPDPQNNRFINIIGRLVT
ncbi:phage head-tail adapter protein [Virgibacillus halodenitrificans]|uniref:Phage head-tail adapter protein n=1 Tax=Virgibacillus halodenitrificans TaxID=1482 RepID=A0AAC9NK90_VIRHA|nr:phage head-tail adapter protein [Virgibacillus halodenitrificans]